MSGGASIVLVDKIQSLADMVCNGTLTEDDAAQLECLLRGNTEAQKLYLKHVCLDAFLQWEFMHPVENYSTQPKHTFAPILDLSSATLPSSSSYFSSGWPVAYLIATAIFAIGVLIGSYTYVSRPAQVAQESQSPFENRAVSASQMQIGQITGMVHCKWTDPASCPKTGHLLIGSTLDLISGLLEITYDTGAKVILEGPVVYQVASNNGGSLTIGKLTGKVEDDTAKGFSISTPTTVITDLGTEFGVEVGQQGDTKARVFRGSVKVQRIAIGGKPDNDGQVLHENESIHVGHGDGKKDVVILSTSAASEFARELPNETVSKIKVFDLVDVVAGGDGFSGRRNAGIDPTNGQPIKTPPLHDYFESDGRYHRVDAMPLVDGVFIPNGRSGKVQIDSEGHSFDGFASTDGRSACPFWGGGLRPTNRPLPPRRSELDGVDYALPGHCLLEMHANKGITFDLDAIRRSNPGWRPMRFRAVVGNTEKASQDGSNVSADIWVLVDGKVRFRRREINYYNGAAPVNIAIHDTDRFLTLAATDGGNGFDCDWTMFGDPKLEMSQIGDEE